MAELDRTALCAARVMRIVDELGGRITAAHLCEELVRRGWADPDLTASDLGFEDDDVLRRPRHG